jgi:hypothetical protein
MNNQKFKFNSKYVYSHPSEGCVKIISLENEDNQVFTISGQSAEVFLKIINGEELSQVSSYLSNLENSPSTEEIDSFLSSFINDLTKLNFIEKA